MMLILLALCTLTPSNVAAVNLRQGNPISTSAADKVHDSKAMVRDQVKVVASAKAKVAAEAKAQLVGGAPKLADEQIALAKKGANGGDNGAGDEGANGGDDGASGDGAAEEPATGPVFQCGALPTYGNAKAANYADTQKTRFNTVTKTREAVIYKAADVVAFQCLPGFTTDGSNDNTKNTFDATCSNMGYFTTTGACVKASKCGAVPVIANATLTPDTVKVGDTEMIVSGAVQFACNPGYSLDGEKVVPGGDGKNRLFSVKCVEFSGEYEAFAGECKPYAFVASAESTRIYGDVFEALFVVTCKGKLTKAFGAGEAPTFDATCSKLKASSTTTQCDTLVRDITIAFNNKRGDVDTHKNETEWFDTEGEPGVAAESLKFCEDLYKLVKVENDVTPPLVVVEPATDGR